MTVANQLKWFANRCQSDCDCLETGCLPTGDQRNRHVMESGHPEVQGAHEEGNGLVVDSFDKWRYEHYFGFSAWKDKSTMVKLISSHAMLLAQLYKRPHKQHANANAVLWSNVKRNVTSSAANDSLRWVIEKHPALTTPALVVRWLTSCTSMLIFIDLHPW